MEMLLLKDDLLDIIEGRADKTKPDYQKRAKSAFALIFLNVEDEQLHHLLDIPSDEPRQAWKVLKDAHQPQGVIHILHAIKKLFNLKLQPGVPMEKHIQKFVELKAHIMAVAPDHLSEEVYGLLLLLSAGEDYENLAISLSTVHNGVDVDLVKTHLLHEYARRHEVNDQDGQKDKALVAKHSKGKAVKKCNWCKRSGHVEDECYKKAFDERKNSHSKQEQGLLTTTFEQAFYVKVSSQSNVPASSWILDSGSTRHMTNDKSLLTNIEECPQHSILVGNKEILYSSSVGKVHFNSEQGPAYLANVLYVPGLSNNLVSTDCITEKGFEVTFKRSCAIVTDGKNRVWMTAQRKDRVMVLNVRIESPSLSATALLTCSTPSLWHQRLGHIGEGGLSKVAGRLGLSHSNLKFDPCEICAYGKNTRSPFHQSSSSTSQVLELVHLDLCQMTPNSLSGCKYFLIIVDDYSRKYFVEFLQNKSQTFDRFEKFRKMAETQTGCKLKAIRSDNGTEFQNSRFTEVCTKYGILQQFTVPYTPQQNGVSERANRTIEDKVRCMLKHANLPHAFWAEAVNTAVYLYNKTPASSIDFEIPDAIWFKRDVTYDHLRVFGCKAFAQILPARSKLDPRTEKCIFLGYCTDRKAWRLYSLSKNAVCFSRDVVFHEHVFPGYTSTSDLSQDEKSTALGFQTNMSNTAEHTANPSGSEVRPTLVNERYDLPAVATPDSTLTSLPESDQEEHERSVVPAAAPSDSTLTSLPESDTEQMNSGSSDDESKYEVNKVLDSRLENGQVQYLVDWEGYDSDERTWEPPEHLRTAKGSIRAFHKENPDKPSAIFSDSSEGSSEQTSSVDTNIAMNTVETDTSDAVEYAHVAETLEPTRYSEVLTSPDRDQWEQAMDAEMASIEKNNTWTLVELPPGSKAIGCKWVYQTKTKADGTLLKFKTRVVAKGYSQVQGIDYTETFAPVAKFTTIRTLLALTAKNNWELHQMDVKTAFLNGELDEEVYMVQPEGRVVSGKENLVCKLNKSLYGLKQAPRAWNSKLHSALSSLGLIQSENDVCLYSLTRENKFLFVLTYVDDFLICSSDDNMVQEFKRNMMKMFEMEDLGEAQQILGMLITRDRSNRKLILSQEKYVNKILTKFKMEDSNPSLTPMDVSFNLKQQFSEPFTNKLQYASLIGSLLYAALGTRPDIMYSVVSLSRYNSQPTKEHWIAAKRVLRYLKGTKGLGLCYQGSPEFAIYSDAEFARDQDNRKSVGGYCSLVWGGCISWQSKKQELVALSSTESEYIAVSTAAREAIWLTRLLREFKEEIHLPVTIFEDNQGCIAMSKNPEHHARTKHIDVKHHFIRDQVAKGSLILEYCTTKEMVADIMTKPLARDQHANLRSRLGLVSVS